MRFRISTILFFGLIISCKAKDPRLELEGDLKNTMQTYLYTAINNDSSNVKYLVLDVTYFEEKDKYICEFKVNMKQKLFDTTGMMKAHISKDLKKVERLF